MFSKKQSRRSIFFPRFHSFFWRGLSLLLVILVVAATFSFHPGVTLATSISNQSSIPIAFVKGMSASYTLKQDGTVWAMGDNLQGQLGNNSNKSSDVPVQVSNLSGVTAIAAGNSGYALKSDGTVWAWGDNSNGQLGNNATNNSSIPVQVSNLTNVIAIEAERSWSYALKSDGTVWAWGLNSFGQLGNNSLDNSSVPVKVSNLDNVIGIAARGDYTAYAVKSDGTVWSWGNYSSRDWAGSGSIVPRQMPNLDNIIAIASGASSTYVIKSDGTVWAWGQNYDGELGNNSTTNSTYPVSVSNLGSVTAITAGSHTGYALKSDGTVWAWGFNDRGQLGDGSITNSTTPVQVLGLDSVVAIAADVNLGYALKSDGSVWAWGYNDFGDLGDITTKNSLVPVPMSLLSSTSPLTVTSVVSQNDINIAVGTDIDSIGLPGEVLVNLSNGETTNVSVKWNGGNPVYDGNTARTYVFNGELSLPETIINPENYTAKVNVNVVETGPSFPIAIASGFSSGYALKLDGTVWTWGSNNRGQLGNNTTINSSIPVQVSNLSNITKIAAGGNSAYVLRSDGTVWAWGYNNSGQLGNNSYSNSSVPVKVSNLDGVIAIAAGDSSGYALKSDGTVWAWGYNSVGQLGNNSFFKSNVPVQVVNLNNITEIVVGGSFAFALKSDGTVWKWGNFDSNAWLEGNNNGNVPEQVSNLSDVTALAVGGRSGYAFKSDGTVWAWGSNLPIQTSKDTMTKSSVPIQIADFDKMSITGAAFSDYALKSDGTVLAWGYNTVGQLGNNSTTSSTVPIKVSNLNNVMAIAAGGYLDFGSGYALKTDGTVWAWGANASGQLGNNSTSGSLIPVQVLNLSSPPLVTVTAMPKISHEINPKYGNAAGLYIGLEEIKDSDGKPISTMIGSYTIEVEFDPAKVAILDVVDEANLGEFTVSVESDPALAVGKVFVACAEANGSSNIDKLFFLPIALTGSVLDSTSLSIDYKSVIDENLNPIHVENPPELEFHRGKIYNGGLGSVPGLSDSIAGLQYLAGLRGAGMEPDQVNLINMASITGPNVGSSIIKPNIKNVISLMQYLANLRDPYFKRIENNSNH